jgi:hypothetical protein
MTQDVHMGGRAANSPAVTALEHLIPLAGDDE